MISHRARRRCAVAIGFVVSLAALSGAAGAKTVLTFAGRATKGDAAYTVFDKAMKDFAKLHPDVTFQYVGETGHDEYHDKLVTLWAAGQAPDVVRLYSPWVMEFADRGLLAEFPANIVQDIKPKYYANVTASLTCRGKLYGFGDENQIHGLAYSKKIMAESGVGSVPDTWDDLMALSTKLTIMNPNGKTFKQAGFCTELAEWCFTGFFRTILESRGGAFAKGKDLLFDSKEGLSAMRDIASWFSQQKIASGNPWDNPNGGKFAFTISYPFYTIWYPSWSKKIDEVFGVAPMPAGPAGRFGHHYTWGICVSAASKHKAMAMEFAQFLATTQGASNGMTYAGAAVGAVSAPSARADFGKGYYADAGTRNWFAGFEKNLDTIKPIQALEPYSYKAEEILWANLQPVVLGRISPEVGLASAKKQLQVVVNRYYK